MTGAYTSLISRLRGLLLEELDVPNASNNSLSELRQRAKNIEGVGGDFRVEAFSKRMADFDGSTPHIEAIASMAANKPTNTWVDQDVQRATLEIAAFCRAFCRAESYAHVYNRADKRQALSVVVPSGSGQKVLKSDFDIMESERGAVDELKSKIQQLLTSIDKADTDIVLASLTETMADFLTARKELKESLDKGQAA
jgi:hypothetical protein